MADVLETVAALLDEADRLLDSVGLAIAENVEDPEEYLKVLSDIFDNEDNLPVEVMEALGDIGDSIAEALDAELTEKSDYAFLNKKARREIEREHGKAGWNKAKSDLPDLTAKEPGEVAAKAAEKKAPVITLKKVEKPVESPAPTKPDPKAASDDKESEARKKEREADLRVAQDRALAKSSAARARLGLKGLKVRQAIGDAPHPGEGGKEVPEPPDLEKTNKKKKAVGEGIDPEIEPVLVALAETLDKLGYDIPEDLTVCDFIEQVGAMIGDKTSLEEAVAKDIKIKFDSIKDRCGCSKAS